MHEGVEMSCCFKFPNLLQLERKTVQENACWALLFPNSNPAHPGPEASHVSNPSRYDLVKKSLGNKQVKNVIPLGLKIPLNNRNSHETHNWQRAFLAILSEKLATRLQNSRWPSNTWGSSLRLLSLVILIHEPGPTWVLQHVFSAQLCFQTSSMKCRITNPSQSWLRPFKHGKQALQALPCQTGITKALRRDLPTTSYAWAVIARWLGIEDWNKSQESIAGEEGGHAVLDAAYIMISDTIELRHVSLSNPKLCSKASHQKAQDDG